MRACLEIDGYEIHRGVISRDLLDLYREEADRVASEAGMICVRHLRRRSALLNDLVYAESFRSFLGSGLIPVRSILFDKNSSKNWPVAWHQDLTVEVESRVDIDGYGPWSEKDGGNHVQPPQNLLERMVTIRLHLDDTPSSNGALRVIPGSHLHGKLSSGKVADYEKSQEVICECSAGDVLLMKPLVLHASHRAEMPERRRVLHYEYAREVDLHPRLSWAESELKL